MKKMRMEGEPHEGGVEVEELEARKEEPIFRIETLADYLRSLEDQLVAEGDPSARRELLDQLSSLKEALSTASLTAERVMVREGGPGVGGFYVPSSGEIAITWETLKGGDRITFKAVLVHEGTHAEGVADEGITQIITEKYTASPAGIYTTEKTDARETFQRKGIEHAIALYDMRNPRPLAEDYLRASLLARWHETLRNRYRRAPEKQKRDIIHVIRQLARDDLEQLEKQFKEGAPRLEQVIERSGFNFKREGEEFLRELAKKEK